MTAPAALASEGRFVFVIVVNKRKGSFLVKKRVRGRVTHYFCPLIPPHEPGPAPRRFIAHEGAHVLAAKNEAPVDARSSGGGRPQRRLLVAERPVQNRR